MEKRRVYECCCCESEYDGECVGTFMMGGKPVKGKGFWIDSFNLLCPDCLAKGYLEDMVSEIYDDYDDLF